MGMGQRPWARKKAARWARTFRFSARMYPYPSLSRLLVHSQHSLGSRRWTLAQNRATSFSFTGTPPVSLSPGRVAATLGSPMLALRPKAYTKKASSMRSLSTIGWFMCQAIGTMQLDRDASPLGLVARAWAADVGAPDISSIRGAVRNHVRVDHATGTIHVSDTPWPEMPDRVRSASETRGPLLTKVTKGETRCQ